MGVGPMGRGRPRLPFACRGQRSSRKSVGPQGQSTLLLGRLVKAAGLRGYTSMQCGLPPEARMGAPDPTGCVHWWRAVAGAVRPCDEHTPNIWAQFKWTKHAQCRPQQGAHTRFVRAAVGPMQHMRDSYQFGEGRGRVARWRAEPPCAHLQSIAADFPTHTKHPRGSPSCLAPPFAC